MRKGPAKETAGRAGAEGAPEERSKRSAGRVDEHTRELLVAREEMTRSHRLLLALAQAAQAVLHARTPDEVYRAVGDEVVRLGYHAVVFTLAEEPPYLVISHMTLDTRPLRAAEKLLSASASGYRFPVARGGIYDQVISTGRAAFFERAVESIAEALPKPIRPLTGRVAALLGLEQSILAPLTVDGQAHGLLAVTGAGLTEADVPAVVVFANQTAIALQNARLHAWAQREIVERVQAEERLRESEEQYRILIEHMGEGIGIVDVEERFTFANPAAHDIFGVPRGNLVGRALSEWTDAEGWATVRAQTDVRRAGQTSVYELDILRPDGQQRSLLVTTTPRFDHEGQLTGSFGVFRDITARVRAEEALRESEERFRTLTGAAPDAIIAIDPEGGITYWNAAATRMFGYTEQETIGKNLHALIAPEQYHAAYRRGFAAFRNSGQGAAVGRTLALTALRQDGTVFPAELSLSAFPVRGRWHAIGIVRDISERVRTEQELGRLNQFLESVVDNATTWLNVHDTDLNIILWNKAAEVISGYSREEVIGNARIWEWLYPAQDYQHEITSDAVRDLARGDVRTAETTIVCKDGKPKVIAWSSRSLLDGQGKLVGTISLGQDVTERKRAEEAQRQSEERFRILFEQATDSILLLEITPEGIPVIRDANSTAFKLLGYDRDELIGQLVSSIEAAPDASTVVEKRRQNILSGMGQVFAAKHRCKDGTIREFECSVTEVQIGPKTFALSVERDITERKRAEEALQEYSARLEEMVAERTRSLEEAHEQLLRREKLAALGQFAGSVAHDLRNPLGAIKNTAYLLHLVLEEPEGVVKEALDVLEREVQAAEKIISGLLDLARIKAPDRRAVNVNLVVQEALSRISLPDMPRVEVVCQLDETLPTLWADPDQLGRIYINLILNAIQAMPDGGRLTVSVSDTGVGIREENLPKLFEPLYTTKAKGTGLGLALVKDLVEGYGGTIEVESEGVPGKGSTFVVRLPVGTSGV